MLPQVKTDFEYLEIDIKYLYVAGQNRNALLFEAARVQAYFEKQGVTQEFCKPATPEQNAHIESYHSIVENVICQEFEFASIDETRDTLNRFLRFYNFERIHSGVAYTSPYKYLKSRDKDMKEYNLDEVMNCWLHHYKEYQQV